MVGIFENFKVYKKQAEVSLGVRQQTIWKF